MKEELEKKYRWYKGQLKKFTKDFIYSNKRTDRDAVLRLSGKVEAYEEILKSIGE